MKLKQTSTVGWNALYRFWKYILSAVLDRLPNIQLAGSRLLHLGVLFVFKLQVDRSTYISPSLTEQIPFSLVESVVYNCLQCPTHRLKGLRTGLIRYLAFLFLWHQSHHLYRPIPNLVQAYGKKEQCHLRHGGLAPQSDGEGMVVIRVRGPRLHRYLSQSYAQLPQLHRDRAAQHEIYLTSLGSRHPQ